MSFFFWYYLTLSLLRITLHWFYVFSYYEIILHKNKNKQTERKRTCLAMETDHVGWWSYNTRAVPSAKTERQEHTMSLRDSESSDSIGVCAVNLHTAAKGFILHRHVCNLPFLKMMKLCLGSQLISKMLVGTGPGPRTPIRSGTWQRASVTSVLGFGRDRQAPGACWTASFAVRIGSRCTEPCLRRWTKEWLRKIPTQLWPLHACTHMHTIRSRD